MTAMLDAIGGALLAVPLLTYAGYPLLAIGLGALAPRRAAPAAHAPAPSIAILIGAHNEAGTIGAKLRSVLDALAAAGMEAEILVGDDGSTDATAAIVEAFPAVRLLRLPRGGKAAALNRLAALARAEVLVLTDADPLFDAATLPALLAPFADPAVGAVAGRVETIRAGARRGGVFAGIDTLFRRYESALRGAEDRLFGCVSADGGLFAIRRALMPVVPGNVTDDFHISTAAVAAGYRIAFADKARAFEHSIAGGRQTFRRRVRITVRGLTALWTRRGLMNPARTGWYALGLVMHKLLRRLAPLALPPLWLVSLLAMMDGRWWWAPVAAGLGLVAAAGIAGALAGRPLPRPLGALHGVALHLAGLALGTLLFLAGRRYTQWTPQKAAVPQ